MRVQNLCLCARRASNACAVGVRETCVRVLDALIVQHT